MTELHYQLAEHVLENGLRTCVQPDPLAPAVAVNLWYGVGSYDEEPGRSGFAHLFEHLMFQGSRDVASGEHMALVEAAGGTVNATTSTDRTNYFETVPVGAFELALWLEANRMASLAITQENFEAQRDVVKEEKRQRYDNQPYGDVFELLLAQHYDGDHPYGHLPIGSMADLDAATLADVQAFFDAWYPPGNASLVICGNVTPDEAVEFVERHFGHLQARPVPGHAAAGPPLPGPVRTTVRRDVPHPLLYLSWPTPSARDDDQLALELALGILTDGHASRLHRSLVRGGGGLEEVHAATLPHLRAKSISTVIARPEQDADTREVALRLREELARFAEEGPSDEELARARAQYEREWLLELATLEGRADAINDAWLTHGEPGRINTRLAEVEALDADDIRRVTAAHFSAEPDELHYLTKETP